MKQYVRYKENVSWGALDNELFVFDEETGDIYVLKKFDSELWRSIEQTNAIDELCTILIKKYCGDTAVIHSKVVMTIERLVEKNLLEVLSYET